MPTYEVLHAPNPLSHVKEYMLCVCSLPLFPNRDAVLPHLALSGCAGSRGLVTLEMGIVSLPSGARAISVQYWLGSCGVQPMKAQDGMVGGEGGLVVDVCLLDVCGAVGVYDQQVDEGLLLVAKDYFLAMYPA